MKLSEYLSLNAISDANFAEQVKSDRTTVSRLRRTDRIPSKELMLEIHAVTGGKVTANDFYGVAA